MKLHFFFKLCFFVFAGTVSNFGYSSNDTIPLLTAQDFVFDNSGSPYYHYTQNAIAVECTQQEFSLAKTKMKIVQKFERERNSDSDFNLFHNNKPAYMELIRNKMNDWGLSDVVEIDFYNRNKKGVWIVDSSILIVKLHAKSNLCIQLLYMEGYSEFSVYQYLPKFNLLDLFERRGIEQHYHQYFDVESGYFYPMNSNLELLTGDSILIFKGDFKNYGPHENQNPTLGFIDLKSQVDMNISLKEIAFHLSQTNDDSGWMVSDAIINKAEKEEETRFNNYMIFVKLSRFTRDNTSLKTTVLEDRYFRIVKTSW
ncbi:MAG: hypothetical protein CVU11_01245 [Bacteroidetes bacterium HGW-Bacteroidetes-6]|jgi:hypothetical protein|nr:MAG: hypothetical protein CVU11_01245 [Bacteroidetes bacterium HGW-Bacteroidetes-6]